VSDALPFAIGVALSPIPIAAMVIGGKFVLDGVQSL
jgi:hypothetical protein